MQKRGRPSGAHEHKKRSQKLDHFPGKKLEHKERAPTVKAHSLRSCFWSGMRPQKKDHFLVIKRLEIKNLFVAKTRCSR